MKDAVMIIKDNYRCGRFVIRPCDPGDCLEVKSEYYQNCSVLGCVTAFTVSSTLMWAVLTGPAD